MNCPKCIVIKEVPFFGGQSHYTSIVFKQGYCKFCKGKRQITWLENIFGVEEDEHDWIKIAAQYGVKIWGQKTLLRGK
jgi:hypothetical protein